LILTQGKFFRSLLNELAAAAAANSFDGFVKLYGSSSFSFAALTDVDVSQTS